MVRIGPQTHFSRRVYVVRPQSIHLKPSQGVNGALILLHLDDWIIRTHLERSLSSRAPGRTPRSNPGVAEVAATTDTKVTT